MFKKIEDTVIDSHPPTEYLCNLQFLTIMDFLTERL